MIVISPISGVSPRPHPLGARDGMLIDCCVQLGRVIFWCFWVVRFGSSGRNPWLARDGVAGGPEHDAPPALDNPGRHNRLRQAPRRRCQLFLGPVPPRGRSHPRPALGPRCAAPHSRPLDRARQRRAHARRRRLPRRFPHLHPGLRVFRRQWQRCTGRGRGERAPQSLIQARELAVANSFAFDHADACGSDCVAHSRTHNVRANRLPICAPGHLGSDAGALSAADHCGSLSYSDPRPVGGSELLGPDRSADCAANHFDTIYFANPRSILGAQYNPYL